MRSLTHSAYLEPLLTGTMRLTACLLILWVWGAVPTTATAQDVIRLVIETDGSLPSSETLRTELQARLGISVIGLLSELESTTEVLVTVIPAGSAFVVLREGTARSAAVEIERGEGGWLVAGLVATLSARLQRRHQASLLMSWDQEQMRVHQTGLLRWHDDRHNGLLSWDVPAPTRMAREGAEGLSRPPR